jgi:Zn ribbon nucleic-acid-binding protein
VVTQITTAEVNLETTSVIGIREGITQVSPKEYKKNCPRCSSLLKINYYEPECMQCGYVDYSYNPAVTSDSKKSLLGAGTRYVLRYVGDFPSLKETVAHVKLQRLRNRIVYGVCCPFCKLPMMQSSLSGKRREAREERYKCSEGHRVSLTPNTDGNLGWK